MKQIAAVIATYNRKEMKDNEKTQRLFNEFGLTLTSFDEIARDRGRQNREAAGLRIKKKKQSAFNNHSG